MSYLPATLAPVMALLDENGDRIRALQRAVKLPLAHATARKRGQVRALNERFRGAVNASIRYYWTRPEAEFTAAARAAVKFPALPAALKNEAQRLALGMCQSTRKSAATLGKKPSRPRYRGGLKISGKAIVESRLDGDGRFDFWVSCQSLTKGKRLRLPAQATAPLRKWLARDGAQVAPYVELTDDDHMIVVVEFPQPDFNPDGEVFAADVGYTNLLATSRGEFLGSDFRDVAQKVARRKPGSKARARARRERDQFVNRELNRLPWDPDPAMQWPGMQIIGLEDLTGIKTGKKKNQSKRLRKKLAPWRVSFTNRRAVHKAQEHGVLLAEVPGWCNSRTCPACGKIDKKNRHGERFSCVECGHQDHADHVGAINAARRAADVLPTIRIAIEKSREERAAGVGERRAKRAASHAQAAESRAKTRAAKAAQQEASTPGPETPELTRVGSAVARSSRESGRQTATEPAPREPRSAMPAGAGSKRRVRRLDPGATQEKGLALADFGSLELPTAPPCGAEDCPS